MTPNFAAARVRFLLLVVALVALMQRHRVVVEGYDLALGVSCDGTNPYCAKLFPHLSEDLVAEYRDVMVDHKYPSDPNVSPDKLAGTGPDAVSVGGLYRGRKLRMTDTALFRDQQERRQLSCACRGCSKSSGWCCNRPGNHWCRYYCSTCRRRRLSEQELDGERARQENVMSNEERASACQKVLEETRKTAALACGRDVACMQFVADGNQLEFLCDMSE